MFARQQAPGGEELGLVEMHLVISTYDNNGSFQRSGRKDRSLIDGNDVLLISLLTFSVSCHK